MKTSRRLMIESATVFLASAIFFVAHSASCQEISGATDNRAALSEVAGEKVIARYKTELLRIPGVSRIGLDQTGTEIAVLVKNLTPEVIDRVPKTLDGWPVKLVKYNPAEVVHSYSDSGVSEFTFTPDSAYGVLERRLAEINKWVGPDNLVSTNVQEISNGQQGIVVTVKNLTPQISSQVPSRIENVPLELVELSRVGDANKSREIPAPQR